MGHSYSRAEGVAAFREAVADKLKRYSGLSVDSATQVVATVGATGALMAALMALLDPEDGVMLFEPFYSYYLSWLKVLDLRPEPVRLIAPDFEITEESLQAAITDRTRAMIICTPNNPSGRRLTVAELMVISAVAEERDLLVITDEVYEDIYFCSTPHIAPATVGTLSERTLSISSLAKSFSIPGWRLTSTAGKPDGRDQDRGRIARGLRADSAARTRRAGAAAGRCTMPSAEPWRKALRPPGCRLTSRRDLTTYSSIAREWERRTGRRRPIFCCREAS